MKTEGPIKITSKDSPPSQSLLVKYVCSEMSEKKSKAAIIKERDETGKFKKGVSGNPRGRPKKKKENEDDLPEGFHEKVRGDGKKALEELLKHSTTKYEAFKYAKEVTPYQHGKKSTIESYAKEDRNIMIRWMSEPEEEIPTIDHIPEEEDDNK